LRRGGTVDARANLRALSSILDGSYRAAAGASAALGVVERLALVAIAFELTRATALATVAASVALAAIVVVERALSAWVHRGARVALVRATVHKLLSAELPVGDAIEEEDTIAAAFDGISALSEVAAQRAPAFAANAVAALVLGPLLLARLPGRVLIVSVASVGFASLTVIAVLSATARWAAATEQALVRIYDDVVAAVAGRVEIVASGRDARFRERVAAHLAAWQRVATRENLQTWVAGRVPALAALLVAGLAVLIDAAARGVLANAVLGDAVLLASVGPTLAGLPQGAFGIIRCLTISRPLLELLEAPESPPGPAALHVPSVPAPVTWQGASFAYPARGSRTTYALRDVDAEWVPGKVVAVVGPNGSGKSTLLRLALGIGRPTSGRVCVGGVDLAQIDLPAWRRQIAYLPQRPFLPERASLRDAVRLIVDDATDDVVRAALERVGLWAALAARREEDPLGIRVGTLSAGQRQRLALARALCRPARLFVLDEPDANLDAEGITLVGHIVREVAAGGMVLLAAHTSELVRLADDVITLVPTAD
jgi:ATP-binding cassette subfamily C protein CydD